MKSVQPSWWEDYEVLEPVPVAPYKDNTKVKGPTLREKLEALDITSLRRLSKGGVVPGGYDMKKPDLIAALLKAGVDPEGV